MNAATTTKAAKAATSKTAAKVSHAKLPPEVIANIVLIDRDRIRVREQVRTEFDNEFIAQLAASIEDRGLRQPIEVNPYGDEEYDLTLGENRLRACDLLKLKKIPCIITKISEEDRLFDQLMENIHRKDLSIGDEAAAVRKAYDKFKDLEAVAKYVNKPKPWVSKRLALTYKNFGYRATLLMEQKFTEDIELLNVMSQIENLNEWKTTNQVYEAIAAGKMNRDQAREKLKELKASRTQSKKDQTKAEEKRKVKAEKTTEKEEQKRQLREEGTGPEFIDYALNSMAPYGHRDLKEVDAFIQALKSEQHQALEDYFNTWADKGRSGTWSDLQICFRPWSPTARPIEQLAMLAGLKYQGQRLELMAFSALIHQEPTEPTK